MGKIVKEVERNMIDATELNAQIRYLFYEEASTYEERKILQTLYNYVQKNTIEGVYVEEDD